MLARSSRPARALGAVAVALALATAACGGGSGGGDVVAGEGTTAPPPAQGTSDGAPAASEPAEDGVLAPDADPVCADLAFVALDPVRAPSEDGEGDGPDEAAVEAALGRLAADAPPEVAGDAALVEAVLAAGEAAATDEDVEAAVAALERLAEWALDGCEVEGVVWGCVQRSTFRPVGQAIEGPDGPEVGTAPVDGRPGQAPTPEEVAGEAEGTRVEVSRTDDTVLFAWLDERGLAVRSQAVVGGPDGWVTESTTECHDPNEDRFRPIPTPIEGDGEEWPEDDLPPPSTTEP